MIECPKCGGYGGEPGSNFGDHGWHPCYFCGAAGWVSAEQMASYIQSEQEALVEQSRGYQPEWDYDDAGDYPEGYWDAIKADHGDTMTEDDGGWEGDGKVRDDPAFFPLSADDIPF